MLKQIGLPASSFVTTDTRASSKRLVNMFSEPGPQDNIIADPKQNYPNPPVYLRRWAGITLFASDGTNNPVRGMWQMQGVVYVVIGQFLYTLSSAGVLTQIGSGIAGSGLVRMVDNTACLVILVPGTALAWTYSLGSGFQQLTDTTFTGLGAIDVGFVDSFIIFLANSGREFYNDDGQAVSGQGQITFTTGGVFPREFGTDLFIGQGVDHREALFFGRLTSEGYLNAGNPAPGTPFSSAPDSFMQIGCHPDAAYSVALQDQSLFWVANDLSVRRRNGQTPMRVSNSGIEAILATSDLTGCYALTPSIAGHPVWVLNMPAADRSIAFDCLTSCWFELESYNVGYWRPLSYLNAFGMQLVGDSQAGQIGFLDTTVFSEFSQPLVSSFVTQSIYNMHNRIQHRRVEAMVTVGQGPSITVAPKMTLYKSDDSGATYIACGDRSLGTQGERQTRLTWFNLGQSRDRVYKFLIADPTPTFAVDITAELEGGKW